MKRLQDTIAITGPFTARDSKGNPWEVSGITIERQGYIADVSVHIAEDMENSLWDDEAFIESVMGELKRAGYQGGPFGRAEMGMQSDSCVMLEPCPEFADFAIGKGWAYAEGMDEFYASRLLAKVSSRDRLMFESSDGTVYGLSMEFVVEHHARHGAHAFAGSVSRSLAERTIPLFTARPTEAREWAETHMAWNDVEGRLCVVKRAPEVSMEQEWKRAVSEKLLSVQSSAANTAKRPKPRA